MPAPRIPRAVMAGKRKPNTRTSVAHQEFIRSLPCLACGVSGHSDQAHIRVGTDGGTGLRPSDRYSVPLCRTRPVGGYMLEGCHPKQHRVGELTFWNDVVGIDPSPIAERLWTISGDREQGRRTISRALQRILA